MRDIPTKTDNVGDTLPATDFNANLRDELQNVVESADFTLDPAGGPNTNLNMLAQAITLYANAGWYYADSGSANTYVLSRVGNLKSVPAYKDGMIVIFLAGNANTGACTINVDSLGTKNFTRRGGSSLTSGQIADDYVIARYHSSGDRFEIVYPSVFLEGEAIDISRVGNRFTVSCEDASTTNKGVAELATDAEVQAGTDSERIVTPNKLVVSKTSKGIVELATNAEVQAGIDDERAVTPAGLQSKIASNVETREELLDTVLVVPSNLVHSVPRGHIAGFQLSNSSGDANHDIDISGGRCRSDDDTTSLFKGTPITKRIDVAWSEGDNQGGLDTGSVAVDTTYHVFAIYNPTTNTFDVLITASFSSPTMPTDYTKKRILGSIYTDGSANIIGFSQFGDEFLWDSPPLDYDSTITTTASLHGLSVATGRKVQAIINATLAGGSDNTEAYLSSPDVDDEAPSITGAPLASVRQDESFDRQMTAAMKIRTNTSGQIRARNSRVGTALKIVTLGWIDRRGKDD